MHNVLVQLNFIKNKVNDIITKKQLKPHPKIIVVTKTFPVENYLSILKSGHIHFGENKIQEAEKKWPEIKQSFTNIKLHMLGKVQSNKAKKAVKLFDYIHSLDNERLALKIFLSEKELNKKIKLFIQVNISNEQQKSGIDIKDLTKFYNYCVNDLSLNVIGLMCLPPISKNSETYFKTLKKHNDALNLIDLSIGMSSDFESAIANGSTYLRLGTVIMGKRSIT